MIVIKDGDILNTKADIICHQVNCRGIMGAGLAKQIKEKYPDAFIAYRKECVERQLDENALLGEVQYIKPKGETRYIANLFAQAGFGVDKRQTDYEALEECLRRLHGLGPSRTIAIPFKLGCGLAGGDWEGVVYPMIQKLFAESEQTLEIWKRD